MLTLLLIAFSINRGEKMDKLKCRVTINKLMQGIKTNTLVSITGMGRTAITMFLRGDDSKLSIRSLDVIIEKLKQYRYEQEMDPILCSFCDEEAKYTVLLEGVQRKAAACHQHNKLVGLFDTAIKNGYSIQVVRDYNKFIEDFLYRVESGKITASIEWFSTLLDRRDIYSEESFLVWLNEQQ